MTEYSGTLYAVTSIQFPAGVTYSFQYDSGTGAGHYGMVTTVTLPGSGTVNYGWTNFTDANGSKNRWMFSRAVGSGTWTYTPTTGCGTGCQTVTVAKPSGDHTTYQFSLIGNGSWATTTSYYSGASTLLAQLQNTYQSQTASADFGSNAYTELASTVLTAPAPSGNLASKTTYSYDTMTYSYKGTVYTGSLGRVVTKKEFAYGSGSPPSTPTRQTVLSYWGNTNRATDVQVQNSGARTSQKC